MDLEQLNELVAPESGDVERTISAALASESVPVRELFAHVSQFAGKRLRPSLIILIAKALGSVNDDHIKLGAVIELIHTATLVHDDILDGASIRRRVSSVNSLHGNHVSVLLGDMIYARAFNLSLSLSTTAAAKSLALITQTICQGEIEQIFQRNNFQLSEEEYFAIIGAKTASLYKASCELSALYAGVPEEIAMSLGCFGDGLGIAFQIVDDCLDIVGEETVVGKSLGTDTQRGKMTLPFIHMAATLSGSDRKKLEEIFLSDTIEDKNRVIGETFDLGRSVDFAFDVAARYTRSALDELDCLADSDYKKALAGAAEFVLVRKV